jgi:sugar lactone lactonase YvrE
MPLVSHRGHRAFVLGVAALLACNSSNHVAPAATGSLTVTINPADGTTPSVTITGPNAYNKTIGTTQTLSGLALGSYTVVADSAVGPDSIVGTLTDTGAVTGSPATVVAGAAANVTVTYALEHRVGGLWVANNNGTLPELASNQLRHSGKPVPAETLATAVSGPGGLALDASGNMWVSNFSRDTLLMYTPAARNAGGATPPSRVLQSTVLKGSGAGAAQLAFDANGNLWVPSCSGGILVEFTAAQLAAGGTQTPFVTITGGGIVKCPFSLAFDGHGNVWVADAQRSHIVEYSAAQLAAGGTPTPVDTIGANSGSLHGPTGLAFDASGNLWVSNIPPTNSVVEYTPAQLAAGGAPPPQVIITMPSGAYPFGIAFDKRGTLWVSDNNHGVMYGLTSAQLTATGAPTPAIADTVSVMSGFFPEQPLFDPYATAVGVSTARVRSPAAPLARVRHTNTSPRRHANP